MKKEKEHDRKHTLVKDGNTEIAKALYDVAMTLTEERAIALFDVAILLRDK